MNGSWDAIDELSGRLAAINSSIDELGDFIQLDAVNIVIVAEHRAYLYDSSSKILEAGSRHRLESLWLEVSALILELAQGEAALVQEARRQLIILNQANHLLAVATSDTPAVAQRYFADLIYSRRIMGSALRASNFFGLAKKWLSIQLRLWNTNGKALLLSVN
ncbi:hypothetical protein [Microbulbifer epialgicus]|uniref:Uncharacterized protein n=1 Tax=Microbulbifer epialgicus TaxID=393907 RepID=A0ABV4P0S2_9GAMM